MPTSLWFLAIDFFIGKRQWNGAYFCPALLTGRNLVYANSLLATLNSRVAIRAANPTSINSIHLSELEFNSSNVTEMVCPRHDYKYKYWMQPHDVTLQKPQAVNLFVVANISLLIQYVT